MTPESHGTEDPGHTAGVLPSVPTIVFGDGRACSVTRCGHTALCAVIFTGGTLGWAYCRRHAYGPSGLRWRSDQIHRVIALVGR